MAKEPRKGRGGGAAAIPTDKFTIEGERVQQLQRALDLDEEARDKSAPEVHVKAFMTQIGTELRFDPASAKIEAMDDATAVISALPLPPEPEAPAETGAEDGEATGASEPEGDGGTSETGGDALERAHDRRIERIDALAEDGVDSLDIDSLGQGMVDAILEIYRHRDKPWSMLVASQQRDVSTAIDYAVKAFTRRAVSLIASRGFDAIPAQLEFYKDKGGAITASIKIALADDQTILALHKASGKQIMLVAADADQFLGKPKTREVEDQSELEFADSSPDRDPPPADDSDLAGEPDEEDEDADEDGEPEAEGPIELEPEPEAESGEES